MENRPQEPGLDAGDQVCSMLGGCAWPDDCATDARCWGRERIDSARKPWKRALPKLEGLPAGNRDDPLSGLRKRKKGR